MHAHCSEEGVTAALEGGALLGKYSPSDAAGRQVAGSSVDQGKCRYSLLFTLDLPFLSSRPLTVYYPQTLFEIYHLYLLMGAWTENCKLGRSD